MDFDMLISATGSHMSLLPEVRKMTPLGRWELVSQFPEECWLLCNFQKSSYSLKLNSFLDSYEP